jgi:hypothetical protein
MRRASAPARTRRRFIPVSDQYNGNRFFTVEDGARKATPLLLVLAVVEISDVVFAVDSIPAVRPRPLHVQAKVRVRVAPRAHNAAVQSDRLHGLDDQHACAHARAIEGRPAWQRRAPRPGRQRTCTPHEGFSAGPCCSWM